MAGSQHPFPTNFGAASQNDLRAQFGGPQRGQLAGIASPGQPTVGIASPQTYNVGVNMQSPADSPIPSQQLQQPVQPTPQQIQQMHMQQRQQQQASQAQQENLQQAQQASAGPQQHSQQSVQAQQSAVSQQTGLQSHQPVSASSAGSNIGVRMAGADGSMPQSSVSAAGSVSSAGVAGQTPQQPPSNQQYNTASLCTYGQETVQDIVSKLQETFQILKTILPPSGLPSTAGICNDKKIKLQDHVRAIKTLFKRLRLIYEKVNDSSQLQGTEYMHIESLIPLKEELDVKTSEERKTSEAYRLAAEECKELIDQVIVKNAQLKEIIDRLRRIIWEINTMLMMRKS